MSKRNLVILSCLAVFAGCGGGEDAGPVVAGTTGSGNAGSEPTSRVASFTQAAGTQRIWEGVAIGSGDLPAMPSYPQITLDDRGMALASWRDLLGPSQLVTSVTDGDGKWSAAQVLAGSAGIASRYSSYVQRTNAAGQRVLLSSQSGEYADSAVNHAFFFTPSIGWSGAVPLSRELAADSPIASDLTVTDDGTALVSVLGYDSLANPRDTTAPAELYRVRPDGAASVGLTGVSIAENGLILAPRQSTHRRAAFAMAPRDPDVAAIQGYFLWQEVSLSLPQYSSLGVLRPSIDGAQTTFPHRAFGMHMSDEHFPAGSPFAATCDTAGLPIGKASSALSAIFILGVGTSSGECMLVPSLYAETDSSWGISTSTIATGDLHDVRLLTNEAGSALLLWSQTDRSTGSTEYWWSQARNGHQWDWPARLAKALGVDDTALGSVAMAMNPAGEAVIAFSTKGPRLQNLRSGQLNYARFNFKSGWSGKTEIAQGNYNLGFGIAVDINRNGKAVVLYTVAPCFVPGDAKTNCTSPSVYAYTL
jgi:hypothetical protein